jgi:NAD-dependent SIR2 family protein deacetylase
MVDYFYEKILTVYCNKCNEMYEFHCNNLKHGKKLARVNGWTVGEKLVRCPDCNGKGVGLCITGKGEDEKV